MVAIVSGNGVGLLNTSANTLGQNGIFGNASVGSSNEGVYVNVANGNLTLQDKDDYVAASGIDLALTRTYNSLGTSSEGVGAQWKLGVRKQIINVTGTVNSAGSTLTRIDGDGTAQLYTYDTTRSAYVSTDGAGAYQSIVRDASGNWTWRDDRSDLLGLQEVYDSSSGRIASVRDEIGTRLTYQYSATGQISQITDATGDVTYFDFSNGNLSQIRTVTAGSTTGFVRTSYAYDGQGRLSSATVDLTPSTSTDALWYTTTYTYDGTSNRIATLTQSDGTSLTFSYISTSTGYKVASVTDGLGRRTSYDYSVANNTSVTDPLGNVSSYTYDAIGQLTQVTQAPVNGVSVISKFVYDSKGNVTSIIDPNGQTNATYDAFGNQITVTDPSGRQVVRTFDTVSNKVLTETVQTAPPPAPVNLITNGTFDTSLAGWTATDSRTSVSGARLILYAPSSIYQSFTTVVGQTYTLSLTMDNAGGSDGGSHTFCYVGTSAQSANITSRLLPPGANTITFTATSTTTYLTLYNSDSYYDANGAWDWSYVDNVSVLANQATQTPPTTQTAPSSNLVVNGTFDSSLSGWSATDSRTNVSGARLMLYAPSSIYQGFTTVVGQSYTLSMLMDDSGGSDGGSHTFCWIGTSPQSASIVNRLLSPGTNTITFTATSTTTYLSFYNSDSYYDANGYQDWSYIDNVSVQSNQPVQVAGTQTTRYVYDAMHRTRFVISSDGRVTEYRYNANGDRSAAIEYPKTFYAVGSLAAGASPTEAQMASWVTSSAPGNAVTTLYTYDARGLVTKASTYATADSSGNPTGTPADTNYAYDQAGQLIIKIDPAGNVTNYSYDGLGRILTTTDANRNVTVNTYDDAHHTLSTTLANGLTTTSVFDKAGELVTVTRTAANVSFGTTRYTYDADGRLCVTTNPSGVSSFALYDAIGRRIADIDSVGAVTEYCYDNANNLTRTIQYTTRIDTSTLFDASGNYLFKALATIRPATNLTDRSTWNVYDKLGRLVDSVDGEGYLTHRDYDIMSRVVAVTRRANAIDISALAANNSPASFTQPAGSTDDRVTRSIYDNDGNLLGMVDPEGYLTEHRYDAAGRMLETIQYQTSKQITTGATIAAARPATTTTDVHIRYVYNSRGQRVGTVDTKGYLTENRYSLAGNLVTTITYGTPVSTNFADDTTIDKLIPALSSPDDRRTDYEYNPLNQLSREIVSGGAVTTYAYDNVGNLVSTTVGSSNNPQSGSQYRYDALGRVTAELSPAGVAALATTDSNTVWAQYATKYTYDSAGNRASMTDPNGNRTLFYYDADNRLFYTVNALGEVARQSYNAFGQVGQIARYANRIGASKLATMSGGSTAAESTTFNALSSSNDTTQLFDYDRDGNQVDQADALGFYTVSKYNAFGEVTASYQPSIAYSTAANTATDPYSRVFYDRDGRATMTVSGSGSVAVYQYDGSGHMTDMVTYANTVSLSTIATATRADVLAKVVADQVHDAHQRFIYDSRGLLAATLTATNVSAGVQQWSLSTRAYDASGNLIAATTFVNVVTSSTPTIADVNAIAANNNDKMVRYYYDSANRLSATATAQRVGANGREWSIATQEYDAAGNVVAQTRLATVLASNAPLAADINSFVATYSTVNDQVTRYVYDAANRVIATAVAQNVENGALTWAVTANTYDKAGNLTQQTQLAAKLSSSTLPASKTQADYRNWILGAASAGNSNVLNRITRFGYDAANRLTTTIDAAGSVSQRFFDAKGNVNRTVAYATADTTTTLIAAGYAAKTNAADRVSRTVYNIANEAVYTIDGLGDVTEYRYDARGNVVKTIAYSTPIDTSKLTDQPVLGDISGKLATAPANRTERRVYDQSDRIRFVIDAASYATETQYDGAGNVLRSIAWDTAPTLPAGSNDTLVSTWTTALAGGANRTTIYNYDASGNLLSTTDAAAATESYQYDGAGRRIKFTNKLNNSWTYQYDAAGRMIQEVSPQVTSYSDDLYTAGTVWTTTHAATNASIVTNITYDAFGNVSSRTEAAGTAQTRTTLYFYDAVGRQVKTVLPSVMVYDSSIDPLSSAGAATRYEKASGELSVVVTYNAFGDAVASKDVGGNVSEKAYDALGRVAYERDALGYVTEYQRDAFGNVAKLVRHAIQYQGSMGIGVAALKISIVNDNANDRWISTTYDALGRATRTTEAAAWVYDPQLNQGGPVLAARTVETEYNRYGDVIRSSIYGADTQGTKITTAATVRYYYDVRGEKTAELSLAEADSGKAYLTEFSYYPTGTLKTRTEYSTATSLYGDNRDATGYKPVASIPGADHKWLYVYDAMGRKTSEAQIALVYTDANGQAVTGDVTTEYKYDALGNQTIVSDALGGTVFTRYDALGRVTAIKKAQTVSVAEVTTAASPLTEFKLDVYGNVVLRIDYAQGAAVSSGATVSTDFSALSPSDANNREVATAYDKNGHAIQVVTGDVLSGAATAELHTTFTSYDAFGRAARQWSTVTDSGAVRTAYKVNTYDALGRLSTETTPANTNLVDNVDTSAQAVVTVNIYNMFGELTSRSQRTWAGSAWTNVTQLETDSYDQAGHLWRSNRGDGVTKVNLYDIQGNATSVIRSSAIGNVNPLDSLASVASVFGMKNLMRTDTSYDLLGHAVSVRSVTSLPILRHDPMTDDWIEVQDDFKTDDLLVVSRPEDSAKTVSVNYRPQGSTSWVIASSDRLVTVAGGYRVFSTAGLAGGSYEFQVITQGNGEVPFESARGTVTIASATSREKDLGVLRLYATILKRAPTVAELNQAMARMNGGATLAQIAQSLLDTGEARTYLSTAPQNVITTILADAFGLTNATDPNFLRDQATWTTRYQKANTVAGDNRGQAIVDLIQQMMGSTDSSAAMVGARARLNNRVTVGAAYMLDGRGNDAATAARLFNAADAATASNSSLDPVVTDARTTGAQELQHLQVAQLYVTLFGRAPEPTSMVFWYDNGLKPGTNTIEYVADQMLSSNEATKDPTLYPFDGVPTAQYQLTLVTHVYQTMLGRLPSDAELTGWIAQLNGTSGAAPITRAQFVLRLIDSVAGYTGTDPTRLQEKAQFNNRAAVALAIADLKDASGRPLPVDGATTKLVIAAVQAGANSQAAADAAVAALTTSASFSSLVSTATAAAAASTPAETARFELARLYVALLNRAPDPTGMAFYINNPPSSQAQWEGIANGLLNSAESMNDGTLAMMKTSSGALVQRSNAEFVQRIYEQAFGQQPLQLTSNISADMAVFVARLNAGESRGAVALAIVNNMLSFAGITPAEQAFKDAFDNKAAVGVAFALDLHEENSTLAVSRQTVALVTATDVTAALKYAYLQNQPTLAAALGSSGTAASQAKSVLDATISALAANQTNQSDVDRATLTMKDVAHASDLLSLVQIYVGLLGRAPDHDGLKFYFDTLDKAAPPDAAVLIYQNNEAAGLYPASLSNQDFVAKVYATIFGRTDVTTSDTATWLQQLQAGTPRGKVWFNILSSVVNYKNATPDAAATVYLQAKQGFMSRVASALSALDSAAATEIAPVQQAYDSAHATMTSLQNTLNSTISARDAALQSAASQMSAAGNAGDGLANYRLQVTLLYATLLQRTRAPQQSELNYWITHNAALDVVAGNFMTSAEAGTTYTSLDDTAFVKLIYNRIMHRDVYDAPSINFWTTQLANGFTRGQVAVLMLNNYQNYTDNTAALLANKASFDSNVIDAMLSTEVSDASIAKSSAASTLTSAQQAVTTANSNYSQAVTNVNNAYNTEIAAINNASPAHTIQAYSSQQSTVTYIYIGLRGYTDIGGLAFWMKGGNLDAMINQLLPGGDSYSFVQSLYQQIQGRTGSYDEISWWANNIDSGACSRLETAKDILYSPEASSRLNPMVNNAMASDNATVNSLISAETNAINNYGAANQAVNTSYYALQTANSNATTAASAYSAASNAYTSTVALANAHLAVATADNKYAAEVQALDSVNNYQPQVTAADAKLAVLKPFADANRVADPAAGAYSRLATSAVTLAAAYTQQEASLTVTARNVRLIGQLYTVLIGLPPTLSAVKYWLDKLNAGASAGDIATALLNGPEELAYGYYTRSMSNDAFVTQLYKMGIGRGMANDQAGLRFWSDQLSVATPISRGQLVADWIKSIGLGGTTDATAFDQRTADIVSTVSNAASTLNTSTTALPTGLNLADYGAAYAAMIADAGPGQVASATPQVSSVLRSARLYMAVLDRAPDAAGLVFWANVINNSGSLDDSGVARDMLASSEAMSLYPPSMSITSFATVLAGRLMGRAPTASELSMYSVMTRAQVLLNILNAAQVPGVDLVQQRANVLFNGKVMEALVKVQPDLPAFVQKSTDALNIGTLADRAGVTDKHVDAVTLGGDSSVQGGSFSVSRTVYTVDRWGNVLTMTDPRDANWVTSYTYNANNELLSTVTPFALNNGVVSDVTVTSTGYDRLGRVVLTVDANRNADRIRYDSNGNVVTDTHADGGIVTSTFNLFGQRLSVQQPGSGTTNGVKTNYSYDHFGNLKTISTDAAVAVYEIQNTDTSKSRYDFGYPTLDAVYVTTKQLVQSFTYDELNRQITVQDAAGATSRKRYDLSGNVIAETDAMNHTSLSLYNSLGNCVAKLDAMGTHKLTWTVDGQGRIVGHANLTYNVATGAWNTTLNTTYGYDAAGRLVQQTDPVTGQNLNYRYVGEQLNTITDAGTNQVTRYAYDRAGNRVREKITYTGTTNIPPRTQNNTSTYDLQNRLASVSDDMYTLAFTYDKNGNRTRTRTTYTINGGTTSFDAYNTYDKMNRQLIVNGVGSMSSDGVTPVNVSLGANSHQLTYDYAGNRLTDTYQGIKLSMGPNGWTSTSGLTVESYGYDAVGRLSSISRDGMTTDLRYYDADGRVLKSGMPANAYPASGFYNAASAAGLTTQYRIFAFDADGHVIRQVTRGIDASLKGDVYLAWDQWNPTAGYDANGNLTGYTAINMSNGAKIKYQITYRYIDGAKEDVSTVDGSSTTSVYDANGNRTQIRENDGSLRTQLWYDSQGHVLQKVEKNTPSFSLIVDGQVLGNETGTTSNVLGTTYASLSDNSSTSAPSFYTVQASGENLQTIARALWGDQNLWYLIADANGLTLSNTLTVGQTLRIPARVSTVHNSADTFSPYDANAAVGDTQPLPPPQKAGGCGVVGKVISVAIAVAVTVALGGTGGPLAGPLTSIFGDAAGTVAANAVAAAAGSTASQAFNMATGMQDSFSWRAVATAAISAGATQGVTQAAGSFSSLSDLAGPSWQATAARAALSNTLAQGINIATGLQQGFNWRAVAASYGGAAVGAQFGNDKLTSPDKFVNAVESGFAAGTTAAILQGGRVSVTQVATDAFGNTLGQSLVQLNSSGQVKEPQGRTLQTNSMADNRVAGLDLPTGTRFFVQPENEDNGPTEPGVGTHTGTDAISGPTPNQYAEYDLGTKDGMRKFLDDKSWQFQTGQSVSSDELATAKAIMSSYFGLEGKEDLSFKAWDNLNMKQVDARFSFYTAEGANSSLPFASPKFASNVSADTLTNYSRKILDTIATAADIDVKTLVVTSTIRTSKDQARIMFDNLQAGKSAKYGEAGTAVVNAYKEHVKAGDSSAEIKSAMNDVVQQYADKGRFVSNHQDDPTKLNTFDVAPSSIYRSSIPAWQDSLNLAMSTRSIDRYFGPNTRTYDPAYHLEITQPRKH